MEETRPNSIDRLGLKLDTVVGKGLKGLGRGLKKVGSLSRNLKETGDRIERGGKNYGFKALRNLVRINKDRNDIPPFVK